MKVAVAGKGGVGKTSLAAALVTELSSRGLRTLAVDCDPNPNLAAVAAGASLLGGPPSDEPLADAVARGIAGVLVADRFDVVVTDLGAGPEFTGMAVGGVLNPAEICVVLTSGSSVADLTAERVERASRRRGVPVLRLVVPTDASSLADRLLAETAR